MKFFKIFVDDSGTTRRKEVACERLKDLIEDSDKRRMSKFSKQSEGKPAYAREAVSGLHDDAPVCRICFDDSNVSQFTAPCACCGSQKFVHVSCLRKWQEFCAVNGQHGTCKSESAHRCGVCLQPYSLAPEIGDSRWRNMSSYFSGILSMLCVTMMMFGTAGSPWPHLALVALLIIASRSQSFISLLLLILMSALMALYVRGLRLVVQGDQDGRLSLAIFRHGTPNFDLKAGMLRLSSPKQSKNLFRESVRLLCERTFQNGGKGCNLRSKPNIDLDAPRPEPARNSSWHSSDNLTAYQRAGHQDMRPQQLHFASPAAAAAAVPPSAPPETTARVKSGQGVPVVIQAMSFPRDCDDSCLSREPQPPQVSGWAVGVLVEWAADVQEGDPAAPAAHVLVPETSEPLPATCGRGQEESCGCGEEGPRSASTASTSTGSKVLSLGATSPSGHPHIHHSWSTSEEEAVQELATASDVSICREQGQQGSISFPIDLNSCEPDSAKQLGRQARLCTCVDLSGPTAPKEDGQLEAEFDSSYGYLCGNCISVRVSGLPDWSLERSETPNRNAQEPEKGLAEDRDDGMETPRLIWSKLLFS